MSPKAHRDVQRMILLRMFSLAEECIAHPEAEDHLAKLEEFAALAYQLHLDVPAPDVDVQDALDARGLLARPFVDDSPEPTPDEVAAVPEVRR